MKKLQILNIIIPLILINTILSQDCENDFTYFSDEIISDLNINVLDGSNCFANSNIEVINELISLNNLNYSSPLEVGVQAWAGNQLYNWVATYTPNGVNGVNQQLTQLPDNINQLSGLKQLYLEWNSLTILPNNFTQLTNLENLAISNNWLTTLPDSFGDLTELSFLDLGYNQITQIPESIGNLQNIEYLWIFNNQLTSVPETICNLPLTWSGLDFNNYPYFAIGGNQICDLDNTPECVATSSNIDITLDQFYYSFIVNAPQDCENECPGLGDLNGDGGYNVLDIVTLANCVLANSCGNF